MNAKGFFLLLVSATLFLGLTACGDPNAASDAGADAVIDAGGGGTSDGCSVPGYDGEGSPPPQEPYGDCDTAGTDGPEEPVSSDPNDGSDEVPNPGPSPVEPRPGQENVRPLGWEKAKPSADGSSVKIVFWSGVEPCYVLDRVEVEYEAEKVLITLFQGSTPSEEEVACIDIALQKVTTVELEEPLGERKIVDGTKS